jgi:hypothetical protein
VDISSSSFFFVVVNIINILHHIEATLGTQTQISYFVQSIFCNNDLFSNIRLRWGLVWEWIVFSHDGKVAFLAIDIIVFYLDGQD